MSRERALIALLYHKIQKVKSEAICHETTARGLTRLESS